MRVSLNKKRKLKEGLWDIGAVKIEPKNPFILTSGSLSPIYIDCRLLISKPDLRKKFLELASDKIQSLDFSVIAGGATAGIPYATLLGNELNYPLIYVRKTPKGHGRSAQIEGMEDLTDKKVLLVEDLITSGTSKLKFVGGIKRAGGKVMDCLAFFNRGQSGKESLKEHGINLLTIVNLDETLNYGLDNEHINRKQYEEVQKYLDDPDKWENTYKNNHE